MRETGGLALADVRPVKDPLPADAPQGDVHPEHALCLAELCPDESLSSKDLPSGYCR